MSDRRTVTKETVRNEASAWPKRTTVSVVVACYNGASVLPIMLDSLVTQTWGGPWEVIIADNGSTDNTRAVAESYADRLPIRCIDASAVQGISHARNRGVEESTGEYLLFFDDDDVMDANYVAAMAQALNEHPYVGGIDRYDVVNPEWLQARGNHDNKVEGGLVKSHYLPFVGGGMIGVRRTVFEAVGGFDERVLRPEDMDFAWRVKHLLGIKPRAVPNAQFYCRARSSLWGNAKQQYLLARGYYRVCWRHGQDQEVVGEEVGPYAYRWARKLLVELVRTVRGWGDMLFWIREAAWHAGLVREAWNLRSDINTISVDKSLPLPRRVAP